MSSKIRELKQPGGARNGPACVPREPSKRRSCRRPRSLRVKSVRQQEARIRIPLRERAPQGNPDRHVTPTRHGKTLAKTPPVRAVLAPACHAVASEGGSPEAPVRAVLAPSRKARGKTYPAPTPLAVGPLLLSRRSKRRRTQRAATSQEPKTP